MKNQFTAIHALLFCGLIVLGKITPAINAEANTRLEQYRQQVQELPQSPTANLQLALVYDEQHQIDAAIQQYQRVLELDPDQVIAHVNLASLYIKKHRYERALRHYERAIELDRNNGVALAGLGFLYFRSQMYPQAIEYYQRAMELRPNDANIAYNLGLLYDEQGEWDSAIEYYRRALAIDPNYADAHYNLAAIFAEQKQNSTQSRAELEKMIAIVPGDVSAHIRLAQLYEAENENTKALEQYQIASQIDTDNLNLLLTVGRLAERLKEAAVAEDAYLRVLDLHPDHAEANAALARIYAQEGYYDEAIRAMEKANALGKPVAGSANIYLQHGIKAINENQFDVAEIQLKKAINSDNPPVEAFFLLAQLKLQNRQDQDAKPLLEKVVTLDPQHVDAHYLLGYINEKEARQLEKAGQVAQADAKYEAAIQKYKTVIELDKNSAKAHYNLGTLYVQKGNKAYSAAEKSLSSQVERQKYLETGHRWYDQAINHFERAVVLDPQNVSAHFSLAKIYQVRSEDLSRSEQFRNQMRAAAFDEYRQVVMYDPRNAIASSRVGLYYAQQQEFATAHEYFDRTFALGPASAEIYADYAQALYLEGKYSQAQQNIDEARRQDPQDARVRAIAGDIYRARGQLELARSEYRQAVQYKPANKEYRYKYARLLEEMKLYSQAIAQYDTTLMYHPENIEAKQRIAYLRQREAEEKEQNRELARQEYLDILNHDPNNLTALINLGGMAAQDGDFFKAQRYFERAKDSHPNSYLAHFNLGLIFDLQEQPTKAVYHYKRCLALHPGFAKAHYYLAQIYQNEGQMEEATRHYWEASQLDHDNLDARARLDALRAEGY